MVELEITVELKSPLSLGTHKHGTVSESLTFLPGSALRGALGRLLARRCGHSPGVHKSCDFATIFEDNAQPWFGFCYPSVSGFSVPFPATARQCKYYPGFSVDDDDAHGIHDALIPLLTFGEAISQRDMEPYQCSKCHTALAYDRGAVGENHLDQCSKCHTALEPVNGFYESWGQSYWQPQPQIVWLSRAAINRPRRVAAEGMLYTLGLLCEEMPGPPEPSGESSSVPTRLRGQVWAHDEKQASLLEKLLPQVTQLGGGISRGLGAVTIAVERRRDPSIIDLSNAAQQLADAVSSLDFDSIIVTPNSLVSRLASFNSRLLKEMQTTIGDNPAPGRLYFSIDCLSDVLNLEQGLPTALLPETIAGAKRIRSFARHFQSSGYSGATGLMRTVQMAIGRGSVFVYLLENVTNESLLVTLKKLQAIENDGLGLDKERGFGRVQICSPFHQEVTPI